MAKELDTAVEAFRTRPLDAGPYTFVAADALVLKVREAGRVVNVHALIAIGVNAEGYREILGIDVTTAEDGAGWLTFLRSLTARGLSGVKLVTSDAHAGLVAAIGATLPGAAWQRCRTHYAANLMAVTPKASWPWVRTLLHSVYDQPDAESVAAQYDRIIDALADKLPKVADHLEARPRRPAGVHRVPQGDLAPDLVQQPPGTAQPGDPPPHRRRRHLPRPRRPDPPRRRRAGRTTRRMGRRPPLPRPRRPQQIPSRPQLTDRTGGHPGGTDRLNHHLEESHDDVVHHVPGLDLVDRAHQVDLLRPQVVRNDRNCLCASEHVHLMVGRQIGAARHRRLARHNVRDLAAKLRQQNVARNVLCRDIHELRTAVLGETKPVLK